MEVPRTPGTPPSMTYDQYKKVVELRRLKELGSRTYTDLAAELGIRKETVINAGRNGIKRYEYMLWQEERGK